jgi:hypothetical protein
VHYLQRIRHPLLLARLVHTRAFRAAHDRDDTLYGFMINGVGMADEPVTIYNYFSAHIHLPFSISILACLPCLILLLS